MFFPLHLRKQDTPKSSQLIAKSIYSGSLINIFTTSTEIDTDNFVHNGHQCHVFYYLQWLTL